MKNFQPFSVRSGLVIPVLALLAACGGPAEQAETPEEYAARINGTAPSGSEQVQPASAQQAKAGAAVDDVPRRTDLPVSPCDADSAGEYLGQGDNPEVRQAIAEKVKAGGGIRFVRPGEAQTQDFNNNRLNVMLDANGIIRDFRCG